MAKKPRRKCKTCGEWFHPQYANIWWCCPEHGAIYALELRARQKVKDTAAEIKEKHQEEKADRQRRAERRKELKPIRHWV